MHTKIRILIAAVGTTGDIHPLLAIGKHLRQRGHEVFFGANRRFETMINNSDLHFHSLGEMNEFNDAVDSFDTETPLKSLTILLKKMVLPVVRPTYDWISHNNIPGRTVLVAPPIVFGARLARERLSIPLATIHFAPIMLRSNFRAPRSAGLWMPDGMPHFIKKGIWRLSDMLFDRQLQSTLNEFRKDIGLKNQNRFMGHWANSPDKVIGLFPDWFAPIQPDWPNQMELTGFPLFDDNEDLPDTLCRFLNKGKPPIVFTTGSGVKKVHSFFSTATDICKILNRRAVFLTQYSDQLPKPLEKTIFSHSYIPLGKLLPRSTALAYHGGIGTCAQALRAGIPHLVTPLAGDQFDNGSRIEGLGVGQVLSRKKFDGFRVAKILASA